MHTHVAVASIVLAFSFAVHMDESVVVARIFWRIFSLGNTSRELWKTCMEVVTIFLRGLAYFSEGLLGRFWYR